MNNELNNISADRLTFDDLPKVVKVLSDRIESLENLIKTVVPLGAEKGVDKWFTIEELSLYIPGKPSISTLRDKARRFEIPSKKSGGRWIFLKSDIDAWLKSGKRMTYDEINSISNSRIEKNYKKAERSY